VSGAAHPVATLTPVPASDLGFETASWARRILALVVDWLASTLVVIAVVGLDDYTETGNASGFIVLGVFVIESALFTALVGGSFGQVVTRLRVLNVDGGGQVPLAKALGRQVLIALVIPPLVFRSDGRGLHDLMTGSAVVRLQEFRRLVGTTT
jgi:uncharacterized RDD family membrane protein YckC